MTSYSTVIETMRQSCTVYTARCYASAVLAMGLCLSVRVRLSVTSRSSTFSVTNLATYPVKLKTPKI